MSKIIKNIIKILLVIGVLLVSYNLYQNYEKKSYHNKLRKSRVLYWPTNWYEEAFEQYFDDVKVIRNHEMGFTVYLSSNPSISKYINRSLIYENEVQNYDVFYKYVNSMRICELLYPYFLDKVSDKLGIELYFLMVIDIDGIPLSDIDEELLAYSIQEWDLQKSLEYLLNHKNPGLWFTFIFDQSSLDQANVKLEEITEKIKELFESYSVDAENLLIDLLVATTDKIDSIKPYNSFNANLVTEYYHWQISSKTGKWDTENIWDK